MSEVWLVRHGQSIENAGSAGPGLGLAPLSSEGERQALALADFLPQTPDLLVVSPYRRSQDTAAPILARFPGLRQEIWPVQEFSYLDPVRYDGSTPAQRRPAVEAFWQRCDPCFQESPGAERFTDLLARARDVLDRLRRASGFLVLVSHGQFLRALLLGLVQGLDFPDEALMRRFLGLRQAIVLPNCGLIRVRIETERVWLGPIEAGHTGSEIREP